MTTTPPPTEQEHARADADEVANAAEIAYRAAAKTSREAYQAEHMAQLALDRATKHANLCAAIATAAAENADATRAAAIANFRAALHTATP